MLYRSFVEQNLKNETPLKMKDFVRLVRQKNKKAETNVVRKKIGKNILKAGISIMILSKSASSIFTPEKLGGVLHYQFNCVYKSNV